VHKRFHLHILKEVQRPVIATMGRGIESTDVTIQSSPPATDSAPTPEITTDQLQVEENVSLRAPRTKFRLGAIITALYVSILSQFAIIASPHTFHSSLSPLLRSITPF
jgi:hypothetical protein